jgi:two-component system response regulator RstA
VTVPRSASQTAMDDTGTILIVEDDERLGELLDEYLRCQGFVTAREGDGQRAAERILAESPTAVILDLMLPRMNGLDVLRTVRQRYAGAVLVLTANKTDIDQVVGLELGADDYVTKPVEPRLLLARLRNLLRRLAPRPTVGRDERVAVGALTVDRKTREARYEGALVELTGVEFGLLWVLASRAGEVVSRDELYTDVLGSRYDGLDRGVDIHLSRVRKKLADRGFDPGEIKSIRGAGYLLAKR